MLFGINENEVILFALILTRITAAFVIFPVIGSPSIPPMAKIGASFFASLLIIPFINIETINFANDLVVIFINIIREVLVGFVLGFIASILFAAIDIAGQVVSMQMGFGIVSAFDPQTSRQVPIMAQFQVFVATMIFLAINGHHFLLEGLFNSFEAVPIMGAVFNNSIFDLNMEMAAKMFISAVKIAAPVMVALLLTTIALGLVARAVPQMNVFIVGYPLKIAVGFIAIIFSLPLFGYLFRTMYVNFQTDYLTAIRAMAP